LSPVVIGPEAIRILSDSGLAGGHLTFLSSPKRYGWDDEPGGAGGSAYWLMHPRVAGAGKSPRYLSGEMFRFLPRSMQHRRWIMEQNDPLPPTEWEDESSKPIPTPKPDFGRADALIWTALAII